MSSSEPSSLQVAQILADLNDLQNSDPTAAQTLLTANKTLSPRYISRKSMQSTLPEPAKFDNLGRRIVGPVVTTPSITRTNSGTGPQGTGKGNRSSEGERSSSSEEGIAPPMFTSVAEEDANMQRARTLIEFYEMKGKFKQIGDTGLTRAKERVGSVVAKYAKKDLEERERVARGRHLGV